jgi:hypothetical protein
VNGGQRREAFGVDVLFHDAAFLVVAQELDLPDSVRFLGGSKNLLHVHNHDITINALNKPRFPQ